MKQLKNSGSVYIKTNHAQSLLELAVFGSLLIMLLGVLVNYGLRYNYDIGSQQHTFRKAMASAAKSSEPGTPITVNEMEIRDRHVPDPADKWGMGFFMPFSGSADVTRTYKSDMGPDLKSELPEIRIKPSEHGKDLIFKTAAFRAEFFDAGSDADYCEEIKDRLERIYGTGNVLMYSRKTFPKAPNPCRRCIYTDPGGGGSKTVNNRICLAFTPEGENFGPYDCSKWDRVEPPSGRRNDCAALITDYNSGQIVDYGTAVYVCRSLVDTFFASDECIKSLPPGHNQTEQETINEYCINATSRLVNPPGYPYDYRGGQQSWNYNNNYYEYLGGAWYCAGYELVLHPGGYWVPKVPIVFPLIEKMFSTTNYAQSVKRMGIQEDSETLTTGEGWLRKTEYSTLNLFTEDASLASSGQRLIIYNDVLSGDEAGFAKTNFNELNAGLGKTQAMSTGGYLGIKREWDTDK